MISKKSGDDLSIQLTTANHQQLTQRARRRRCEWNGVSGLNCTPFHSHLSGPPQPDVRVTPSIAVSDNHK